MNGTPINTSVPLSLSDDDLLTGVLEDGTAIAFGGPLGDTLHNVRFTSVALPIADLAPRTISEGYRHEHLRPGQALTVLSGAGLQAGFTSIDASLTIDGGFGSAGSNLKLIGGRLALESGTIGNNFRALRDATVQIDGGSIGDDFHAMSGSTVNMTGGRIGDDFRVASGATFNLTGGSTSRRFVAQSGSVVRVDGGWIGQDGSAESGSLVNVTGGSLVGFTARQGSLINLAGGNLGSSFTAEQGSLVNASAGRIGPYFTAKTGSRVTMTGGILGSSLTVEDGSDFQLVGGDFLLNGQPVAPGTLGPLQASDILTGVLKDGSAFVLSPLTSDNVSPLTLVASPLPAVDTSPMTLSNGFATHGLRDGQSLTVNEGGLLPDGFAAVHATLNISGGASQSLRAVGSDINLYAGSLSGDTKAMKGSTVNVFDGSIGSVDATMGSVVNIYDAKLIWGLNASDNSVVNVFDAEDGGSVVAEDNSRVNVFGGNLSNVSASGPGSKASIFGGHISNGVVVDAGADAYVTDGSIGNIRVKRDGSATITGGVIGSIISDSGSQTQVRGGIVSYLTSLTWTAGEVQLFGGEFKLNGTEVLPGSEIAVNGRRDVLTGTLEDGSSFVSGGRQSFVVTPVARPLPAIDTTPMTARSGLVNRGLRAGQSLTVLEGAVLPSGFAVISAELSVDGGVGEGELRAVQSKVSIDFGDLGQVIARSGTQIAVRGGRTQGLYLYGSEASVTGGELGTLNIDSASTARISGGDVQGHFRAQSGSTISLVGSSFFVNGLEADSLIPGEPQLITDRDVSLSGTLSDGTPFSFDLNSGQGDGRDDFFAPDALLTISLATELPGDFNNDGTVDAADYTVWRDRQDQPAVALLNDIDGGIVGAAQRQTWAANYGAPLPAVTVTPGTQHASVPALRRARHHARLPMQSELSGQWQSRQSLIETSERESSAET